MKKVKKITKTTKTTKVFNKRYKKVLGFTFLLGLLVILGGITAYAIPLEMGITLGGGDGDPAGVVSTLQVLFLFSLIALAPSLLILMTGFIRIIIVLSFMRQAMATQQMPPNQVLIGIALFLTIFVMTPVFNELNENALQPFGAGEISMDEAIELGMYPIRRFMFANTNGRDLALFLDLAQIPEPEELLLEDVPNNVLIPAFILSELTTAFIMGFVIYLPFIVIDMVTASVLMAMGMMMLPPAMISLPFKIMTFLLAGGWSYIIEWLMRSFDGVGW